ncbi:MAG TPA: cytidylate kinase, partial [Rhodocyclaceae bacterium]|nr:cytidylate kinase [Rhodocyclaceae bacterium]
LPAVRDALLALQRASRRRPGLVADGRDMGSVVFPDACVKVFLTASPEVRAERRYKQLIAKGFNANIDQLRRELAARDAQDRARAVAPLQAAPDARQLDTTAMTIDEAVATVLEWVRTACAVSDAVRVG